MVNSWFGGGTNGKLLVEVWCEKLLRYFFKVSCLKNRNNDEIIVSFNMVGKRMVNFWVKIWCVKFVRRVFHCIGLKIRCDTCWRYDSMFYLWKTSKMIIFKLFFQYGGEKGGKFLIKYYFWIKISSISDFLYVGIHLKHDVWIIPLN